MSKILFTLAEEPENTTPNHFAVRFRVDENDCFDFADGLKTLGHDVYFVNWADLNGDAFSRMFHHNNSQFVEPVDLAEFDLAFVYKMEGFYFDKPRFFAMVDTFARHCKQVVNTPTTIKHNIDKHYFFDLEKLGVEIIPTFKIDDKVESELKNGKKFVIKPRYGERGNGIFVASEEAHLTPIKDEKDLYLAQTFMPEIRDGERSAVFLGHQFEHAVLKKPAADKPDEFRCNESLGGTVEIYQPTEIELAFCERVLPAYEQLECPVHFSRIDFISTASGPLLLEAEMLNPSIYANYSKRGAEFGRNIANYFDGLIARKLSPAN